MTNTPFRQLNDAAVRYTDDRGYLDVLYEQGQVVLKRSFSKAGVFRGMHWQRPTHAQTKLIRVAVGRILDFIVDPSQVPAQLHRRELTPADGWVQIDAYLAHGFYAMEDTEFEYLCLGAYNESAESSYSILAFLQSELGLTQLNLSAKDRAAQPLSVVDGGLDV
ncbi:MAG: dTDP-4-dehydrorhamnose 3,5-epimerase family protein [Rhodocyclales bacterium]|nr:dTDP-4-dehydrorhamnose 3,5-epimerase family protein [Rhodocyclales bacterium]